MFKKILILHAIALTLLFISSAEGDPQPYLRIGSTNVLPPQPLSLVTINKTQWLYCDAFQQTSAPDFDGLTWSYYANSTVVYSNPIISKNDTYQTYSLLFMPFPGFNGNLAYQCCTTLKNAIVKCQPTYILVDPNFYNGSNKILSQTYFLIASILIALLVFWFQLLLTWINFA